VANRDHPLDWVQEAEQLIASLRNVKGCSITVQGDEIVEINVLADGERPAKQIVRDVRSALKAELKLDIDYRKISIALKRDDSEILPLPGDNVIELVPTPEDKPRSGHRLRFGGVTVSLNTLRCQVNVELGLGEQEAMGEAIGSNSRQQVPRLIAEATLRAVERFLGGDYALCLNDLELVTVGSDTIALINVKFQSGRRLQTLSGSCVVEHDLQQSVVYATLDSLNRILGQLIIKEPVEYELRPTSI
jgi:hypothetical protein